jgi:hypothetical protein
MKSVFVVVFCVLAGCVPVQGGAVNYGGGYSASVTVSPDTRHVREISCTRVSSERATSTAATLWNVEGRGLQVIEFEVAGGGYEESFLSIGLEGGASVDLRPKIYVEEWLKSNPPQPVASILHFAIPFSDDPNYPVSTQARLFVRAGRLLVAHTAKLRAYQWVDGRGKSHVEFPEGLMASLTPEGECLAAAAPKSSSDASAPKPSGNDLSLDDDVVNAYFARRTKGVAVDPRFTKLFLEYAQTGNPKPLIVAMPSLLSPGRQWSEAGTASGDRNFSGVLVEVLEAFQFEPVFLEVHRKMFVICLAETSGPFETCVLGVLDDLGNLVADDEEGQPVITDKNGNTSKLGGRKK